MAKEKKTNAVRMIERAKIPHTEHEYECTEFTDGLASTLKTGIPPEKSFKTLVTRGKSGSYYVLVIPVAEEVDFKKAAKAAGEKSMEMIHVKELTPLTGYIRGGCSPIGMKKQFPTLLHESAKKFDTIVVSGGRIGLSVELAPDALLSLARGQYADLIHNTNSTKEAASPSC